MKAKPPLFMERARVAGPPEKMMGAFKVSGPHGMHLLIIVSDGGDWSDAKLPLPVWEHVSVSLRDRCPTWAEMEWVREQFFNDDELVIQLSMPREKHINCHHHCLHMWRPVGVEIPLPPPITVAPVSAP